MITTSTATHSDFRPTSTANSVRDQLERQRDRLRQHPLLEGIAAGAANGASRNGLRRAMLHAHEALDAVLTELIQQSPELSPVFGRNHQRSRLLHEDFSMRALDPRTLPLSRAARRVGDVLWVDRLHLPFVAGHALTLEALRQELVFAGLNGAFTEAEPGPTIEQLLQRLPVLAGHEGDLHCAIGASTDLLIDLLDEVPYVESRA